MMWGFHVNVLTTQIPRYSAVSIQSILYDLNDLFSNTFCSLIWMVHGFVGRYVGFALGLEKVMIMLCFRMSG